jgi:hypothetical protein
MPRYELGRRVEERLTFVGTFQKYGTKPGHAKRPVTLLLVNITLNGRVVCDHVWVNRGKQFDEGGWLRPGDRVRFDARVRTYRKGNQIDYKLTYPTRVMRLPKSSRSAS